MKNELKVAAVQLTSTKNVKQNLDVAGKMVREAAMASCDLIVLPENFGYLGSESEKRKYFQTQNDSLFLKELKDIAQEYEVFILAGTIPEQAPSPDLVYNTSILINKSGSIEKYYRKIHLFDAILPDNTEINESKYVARGNENVMADISGWQVGISICYDLRFPELYRQYSDQGAHLFLVPAAFTLQTGKDHWQLLVRARAVENLCYVVAANQFGCHSRRRQSLGKSMIVDPWGNIIAQAKETPDIIYANLKASYLEHLRSIMPSLLHRQIW